MEQTARPTCWCRLTTEGVPPLLILYIWRIPHFFMQHERALGQEVCEILTKAAKKAGYEVISKEIGPTNNDIYEFLRKLNAFEQKRSSRMVGSYCSS